MLLHFIPKANIILEEAKTLLHSLYYAAYNSQPTPQKVWQHVCVEKYEVQNSTFYTPQSSIYPHTGSEQSLILKAPILYFWIPRSLEVLMLLQSMKLIG